MNLYLIFYLFGAIAVVLGGIYKLYGMNQTVAALLYGVGASAVMVLYGLRWFADENSILARGPVQWPPMINTCPDYLTRYTLQGPSGKQEVCVDLVGVSQNQKLARYNPDSGRPPTEGEYFPIQTKSSDPAQRNNELCQRAMTAGLTWEGITNGESCILPDGSKATPSSGSGSCS